MKKCTQTGIIKISVDKRKILSYSNNFILKYAFLDYMELVESYWIKVLKTECSLKVWLSAVTRLVAVLLLGTPSVSRVGFTALVGLGRPPVLSVGNI